MPVSVIQQSWNELLNEDKAMHELTEYYKHIFTLKSGVQVKIFTEEQIDEIAEEEFTDTKRIIVKGFILTPLIVKKSIKIRSDEIAASEHIREKYIAICPWPETEDDSGSTLYGSNVPLPVELDITTEVLDSSFSDLPKPSRSVAEMKVEAFNKYKTKDNKFEDFSIGVQVKVITPCEDHNFFYGETGKVVHSLEGIKVEFDIPRKFEDGTIQKTFNFNPQDLITIFNLEKLNI